jgi:hypothetical protein
VVHLVEAGCAPKPIPAVRATDVTGLTTGQAVIAEPGALHQGLLVVPAAGATRARPASQQRGAELRRAQAGLLVVGRGVPGERLE